MVFDTMVSPGLMYGAAICAPCLPMYMSAQIENSLVIIAQMICCKAYILYKSIQAELVAAAMILEALLQIVNVIIWIWTSLAFEILKQMETTKYAKGSQYSQGKKWFIIIGWTSKTYRSFNIVHLYKIMKGTRYSSRIYHTSISKRLGSHQGSHFPQRWPPKKIISWTLQRINP